MCSSRPPSTLDKSVSLSCIYVFPRERRINRYYDPTTDQFLSVDPKVATTDQSYVFTNDDPLNATDPLGLCWFACGEWHDVTNAGDHVGQFVKKHIGDIATVAAIAVCVGSAGAGCAVATGIAVAARVYQRHEEGTPYLSASNFLDAGITIASGGLLGGAAHLGEGAFAGSSSAWAYAYRVHTAAPDILGWIVGEVTHKDVP